MQSEPTPLPPLLSVLHPALDDSDLIFIDCRCRIVDLSFGRRAYDAGHIPGAFFVDMETELSQKPGPGRHPLPSPLTFQAAMQRCGLHSGARVVAYDDLGGLVAARLWWLLKYFGFERVSVLQEGIQGWQASGRPLSQLEPENTADLGRPENTAGHWRPEPGQMPVIDRAGVVSRPLGQLLLDAREAYRYRGESEPIDPRAGHIPGALSLPFTEIQEAGKLAEPRVLLGRLSSLGITPYAPPIVYCGSGVTACYLILACQVAGFGAAVLYEGSWSDWCSDPHAPIETGAPTLISQ